MSIQDRLQLILKMHNLSPSAFADRLGVQRSNISHVLSGRNKPSLDFLEKILVCYPRVNAHWLITGVMPTGQSIEKEIKIEQKENPKNLAFDSKGVENKGSVVKIVEFLADGTFKVYFPSQQ